MVPGSVSQHRGSALSLQREPKKAVPGADLFQRRFRDAEDAPAVVNSEPFCWEGRIECGHRTSHLHLLIIFSHLAMWASSWGDIFDQAFGHQIRRKGGGVRWTSTGEIYRNPALHLHLLGVHGPSSCRCGRVNPQQTRSSPRRLGSSDESGNHGRPSALKGETSGAMESKTGGLGPRFRQKQHWRFRA